MCRRQRLVEEPDRLLERAAVFLPGVGAHARLDPLHWQPLPGLRRGGVRRRPILARATVDHYRDGDARPQTTEHASCWLVQNDMHDPAERAFPAPRCAVSLSILPPLSTVWSVNATVPLAPEVTGTPPTCCQFSDSLPIPSGPASFWRRHRACNRI